MKGKRNYPLAENASINYAPPKKYIKKYGQELRTTSTASSAKTAIRTTTTIFIASSVSKYTPITARTKTTISGSAAITANAGYVHLYTEPH